MTESGAGTPAVAGGFCPERAFPGGITVAQRGLEFRMCLPGIMPAGGREQGGGQGIRKGQGSRDLLHLCTDAIHVRLPFQPVAGEGARVAPIAFMGAVASRVESGEVFCVASPAEGVAVAAAFLIQQIDDAWAGGFGAFPCFGERIPAPSVDFVGFEEFHSIAYGDAAEFIAVRRFFIGRRAIVDDIAPEELHVVVLIIADVAGDIEVLPAKVGSGVEKVHEVTAADDRTDDRILRDDDFAE